MTEELKDIRKDLSKKLKKERFEHTIGVMYTASSLTMCYGEDIQKALTAGLLHDCGKYCSSKDQIKLCRKYKISLTDSELEMPALIHAKLGAYLARHEYKIEDQDIIDAITYHTTGRPGMTLLEKIIYIAIISSRTASSSPDLLKYAALYFRISTVRYICLPRGQSAI